MLCILPFALFALVRGEETCGGRYGGEAQPDPKGITWSAAYSKATTALAKLSNPEKVGIVTGQGWQKGPCVGNTKAVSKIGLPSLCLQDGPVGVRYAMGVTVFPAGVHAASTWDVELMRERGLALGQEARGLGIHVQLGPVAGPLGKIPGGGRNWEGFSPDPYLTGIAMQETILGMQAGGVQANAKHYIANEQELERTKISSDVDDRTMHELYLWPFADAVRANVASIMCSYNKLNGTWACENDKVLNKLLKTELDFKGYVMSDWGAQHTNVESTKTGLDMTMPGDEFGNGKYLWGPNLEKAVPSLVPQSRLDDMVRRILAAWYYLGQDSPSYPKTTFNSWKGGVGGPDVQADHKKIARAVARDGIVLLKNENNALPLKKPKSLAIIGDDAIVNPSGANSCPDRNCDKGTLAMGWGSGTAEYPYLSAPFDAIKARAAKDGTTVTSSTTDNPSAASPAISAAETAIVFINANSGEEYIKVEGHDADRANLDPWHNGNELVAAVANSGKPTVVVIHSVGPIILEKILALKSVVAIVWAGLPGQESGNSLLDILYGDTAPSGKLPYTIAKKEGDYGVKIQKGPVDKFEERIYIDYRHFDKAGITPRYEFGFGLSYTTFQYSAPSAKVSSRRRNCDRALVNETASAPPQTQSSVYAKFGPIIIATITNSGKVAGAEVAQLYLSFPANGKVDHAPWQLRGFKKVMLKPGESKTVSFELRKKDVSYWDVGSQSWVVVGGDIKAKVAGSSRQEGVEVVFKAN
ncbi:glycoside hydrolase family 3 protein [Tothia fuscella]|uniref:beta-glucosidase n=1 Tax=Tothia fuscella TaxID=1048955 RepID=A0A9P4TVD2_9PEZI|nr:glycoside hydrolase family 3 protein [Tothia fuscella]